MYNCIRIERERDSFVVKATDPEIEKANRARDNSKDAVPSPWRSAEVEFEFDTKEQVLKFIDKAMDIALPKDDYSSVFDKLARQVKGKSDE